MLVRPKRLVKGLINQETTIRLGIKMVIRDHHDANQNMREDLEHAWEYLIEKKKKMM